MTAATGLERGRAMAEGAAPLKLKHLPGALLLLGRVTAGEPYIARAINMSAQEHEADMGNVIVRFSRLLDALSMSLDGWILVRVAPGGRIVGPTSNDYALVRQRFREWRINT